MDRLGQETTLSKKRMALLRYLSSGPFGMVKKEQTVAVKIPAGVEEGMQLKVGGKGNEAPANGLTGDLLVVIEEQEHDRFVRENQHLHLDLYISFSEAALGVSKDIDLLEGKVRIKLDSGMYHRCKHNSIHFYH